MKAFIFVFLFTAAYAYFTDMDETIDLDALLQNPVETLKYIDCWLDKQPCTKQMEAYKQHIKDFFDTACSECDDKMKHLVEEFLLNALVNYPDEVQQLRKKYDPSGSGFSKLAFEVSKY